MAILELHGDGGLVTLAGHTLVGRSSACALRLNDPRISAEHARLVWRDERWHVHDLGSRNGTFINGTRLESGGRITLTRGDTIAFGDARRSHRLLEVHPPVPVARALDTGEIVGSSHAMLVLPDESEPRFCIYESEDGDFVLEHAGQACAIRDGELIHVSGRAFVVHLPKTIAPTLQVEDTPPGVEDLDLRLEVSRDEEHVQVFVDKRGQVLEIPPRSHHYTLLTLARLRMSNERTDERPEPARGWVSLARCQRKGEVMISVGWVPGMPRARGPLGGRGALGFDPRRAARSAQCADSWASPGGSSRQGCEFYGVQVPCRQLPSSGD